VNKHVKPEKLTGLMTDLLKEYGDEVYQIVEEEAKDAARKATSELRQVSPGDYARQWRHRADKNGKTLYRETVYNVKYQLTHLLEKEHDTGPKRGGHYPANPGGRKDHTGEIAKVEEKYNREYFDELVKRI